MVLGRVQGSINQCIVLYNTIQSSGDTFIFTSGIVTANTTSNCTIPGPDCMSGVVGGYLAYTLVGEREREREREREEN